MCVWVREREREREKEREREAEREVNLRGQVAGECLGLSTSGLALSGCWRHAEGQFHSGYLRTEV
jgi:hypothetical protein